MVPKLWRASDFPDQAEFWRTAAGRIWDIWGADLNKSRINCSSVSAKLSATHVVWKIHPSTLFSPCVKQLQGKSEGKRKILKKEDSLTSWDNLELRCLHCFLKAANVAVLVHQEGLDHLSVVNLGAAHQWLDSSPKPTNRYSFKMAGKTGYFQKPNWLYWNNLQGVTLHTSAFCLKMEATSS